MTIQQPTICIAIAGSWHSQSEAIASLDHLSNFKIAGGLLRDSSGLGFAYYCNEPERDLSYLYDTYLGTDRLSQDELDELSKSRFVLNLDGPHLIEKSGGALVNAALQSMFLVAEIMANGGLCVDVLSSGNFHSAASWLRCCEESGADDVPYGLYAAYVVPIVSEGEFYSCGMHCMGFPDVEIEDDLSRDDGSALVDNFNLYQIDQSPEFSDGMTFAIAKDTTKYSIRHQACTNFEPDSFCWNPFGVWHLVPQTNVVSITSGR